MAALAEFLNARFCRCCLVGVVLTWRLVADQSDPAFPNGVASGDVSSTAIVVWARGSVTGEYRVQLATDPEFSELADSTTFTVSDPAIPIKHPFEGLSAATEYFYRFTNPDGQSAAGSFRTAALPVACQGLRFGVSGDWRGELSPFPSLNNAPDRRLDFFVKLGDTVYADVSSPALESDQARTLEEFRLKHAEVYAERFGLNAFANLQRSTSVFATIDDHEVTNDFAGGAPADSDPRFSPAEGVFINDTELFRNGLRAFVEYNPIAAGDYDLPEHPRFHGKPKLYRARWFGLDAALFLLDARSFRDAALPPIANPTDAAETAAFIARSFDLDLATGESHPRRTILGGPQLDLLKEDLLRAHGQGIVWKIICVPEPIQNLSAAGAEDRFEGYAAERSELLRFIHDQRISNVVFIAADVHGTLVNNLTYQVHPDDPQIVTGAFEVTTGPVAYDKPFGPTILNFAAGISVTPMFTLLDAFLFPQGLPNLDAFDSQLSRAEKNEALLGFANLLLGPANYDPIGLEGSPIDATVLEGGYVNVFNFGWTEFEIAEESHELSVTVFGIDHYSAADVGTALAERQPAVLSRWTVTAAAPVGPRLSANYSDDEVELWWPSFWEGFELQTGDRISAGAPWTAVEIDSVVDLDRRTVRVPMVDDASRYFRLVK